MAKTSHRKPVTTSTPKEQIGGGFPSFNKQNFDESVFANGYEIFLEKALKCPCRGKSNNQPLSDCKNCGGIGWFFIDKTSTRAVIQSMNRQEKYKTWTAEDVGTVSISLRDDNEISFMDRVTVLDLMSSYSEVIRPRPFHGNHVARLIYEPIKIESIYMFVDSNTKLYPLLPVHYSVEENRITINSAFSNIEDASISIRYKHNPQYHIVDITREQVANRNSLDADCDPKELTTKRKFGELLIHGVARKAQIILDSPDLLGESLFDNTTTSA